MFIIIIITYNIIIIFSLTLTLKLASSPSSSSSSFLSSKNNNIKNVNRVNFNNINNKSGSRTGNRSGDSFPVGSIHDYAILKIIRNDRHQKHQQQQQQLPHQQHQQQMMSPGNHVIVVMLTQMLEPEVDADGGNDDDDVDGGGEEEEEEENDDDGDGQTEKGVMKRREKKKKEEKTYIHFELEYSFVTDFGIKAGRQRLIVKSLQGCYFNFDSRQKTSGTFHSPNYPNSYPKYTDCYFIFARAPNEILKFKFSELHIDGTLNCDNDVSDYLEIFDQSSQRKHRICNHQLEKDKQITIRSTNNNNHNNKSIHVNNLMNNNLKHSPSSDDDNNINDVIITFHSNHAYEAKGFNAEYHYEKSASAGNIQRSIKGSSLFVSYVVMALVFTLLINK
ncbi:hypothetical protein HELRODRAFT_191649 [Helobdella robusta]|uniref:CUB domain-containing protein n=1 Tax=Helobdella robusta TaxID=6412 RepID=T1FT63_HELRO|nr:hypothetical protein HELRODRAFT_191649 [Helobdella robusta]ESO04610.1 hypothetical protein HELRODRAFT_191649 [Helobdella robusta]